MKNFFKALLAIILVCATVYGVYFFTGAKEADEKAHQLALTTVSKAAATEKYANKIRLASLDRKKYYLYATDDNILLQHRDKLFEFKRFSNYIDLEKPKMYCFDIDSDDREDIIVRGVSGQEQGTGDFVYDVYILHRKRLLEEDYELINATQDTWHRILDNGLREELSQLKTCKKYAQFAMTVKSNTIQYDGKTGIANKNAGYVGYFRALQDGDGKYMTVENWNKGKGSFYVNDENKLCCEVEVIVKYLNSETVQRAGKIYFEMHLNKSLELVVTQHSMVFEAYDDYKIADPKDTAKNAWKSVYKNSAKPKGSEAINWVKYSVKIDPATLTQTSDLAKQETDIKFVDTVTVTESALIMTAKDGYTFDEETAKKGEYSVTINKGKDNEYEISYTAELSADKKTLKINFDKTYPRNKVGTVSISFGSK